jgi:hypothetical protein
MAEEGATLMDGDMLKSELVASFDQWLTSDVKRTLSAILIAQVYISSHTLCFFLFFFLSYLSLSLQKVSKIEGSVSEVSKLLTELMNKVISVSFSASKFLLKSSNHHKLGGGNNNQSGGALMPTDRNVKLRTLSRKQWRTSSLENGVIGVALRLFERVVPQEAVFLPPSHGIRKAEEDLLENQYEAMEEAKQVCS